jgi:SAM-dependent methyltransferase
MGSTNKVGSIYTNENGGYLRNNPTWHTEDSAWKAEQILQMLRRNSIPSLSVVEVGCGAGEIVNQLHHKMPTETTFTGYDISSDAIQLAKKKTKERLSFIHDDLTQLELEADLLLMIDVFEHVDDYLGFLRACKNKANYTIFHIPLDITIQAILRNMLVHGRETVGHLHYFTKETALATLRDSGYEIVDWFYTAGALDLPRKTFLAKLAYFPRKILFLINKDFSAKTLGGFSLLVMAK